MVSIVLKKLFLLMQKSEVDTDISGISIKAIFEVLLHLTMKMFKGLEHLYYKERQGGVGWFNEKRRLQ